VSFNFKIGYNVFNSYFFVKYMSFIHKLLTKKIYTSGRNSKVREKTYTITVDTGDHARPATLLVNEASQYQSKIDITYRKKSGQVKSIMGVVSLGIPMGASITITAEGEDEDEAIQGISTVIEEHLGE